MLLLYYIRGLAIIYMSEIRLDAKIIFLKTEIIYLCVIWQQF